MNAFVYISLGGHHMPSPLIGMKFNDLQIEKESKNGMNQLVSANSRLPFMYLLRMANTTNPIVTHLNISS